MNKKCRRCGLVNFADSARCSRCETILIETQTIASKRGFLKSALVRRVGIFLFAAGFTLFGFYASLVVSAKPLILQQKQAVARSIDILESQGFEDQVFLLKNITVFRGTDNWLNSSVEKENAYAATNFPFEIMTLYPDFFQIPVDDVERGAILLHESIHLAGGDEKDAYEFVWKNRHKLGWTADKYYSSVMWHDVRRQTREYLPEMFICQTNDFGDCTEVRQPTH